MQNLIKRISESVIVPVVSINNAENAVSLASALRYGGINCAEITFRTAAAEESIYKIRKAFPDMLIAAGTVLSVEQAEKAINAGADFLVSPGTNVKVVGHCLDKGYRFIPGICTPSEVEAALSLGIRYMKFFPAEAAGGVKMLKALSAPYRDVFFMPTGGINTNNIAEYLSCKNVFACGGSWMVPPELTDKGDFETIKELSKEAVNLIRSCNI